MTDRVDWIVDTVQRAIAQRSPIYIRGGDSKRSLCGRECRGEELDVSGHRGIVDYHSAELVVTARAGTPLEELQQVLATEGQFLPFEPPLYQGRATLGGTLACNLSGPARPWRGSVRDMVLGLQLVNGRGQLLNFGGQVMKNVAGYDVSRLQAGAQGTLGVITQISLKVLPCPEHTLTLAFECSAADAVSTMNRRAGEPRPLSGACWFDEALYLRLCGARDAVEHSARLWGGEHVDEQQAPWQGLRDMTLPFFQGESPLWRLSLKSTAPVQPDMPQLIDWGGALRWLRVDSSLEEIQALAAEQGGHAGLFAGGDRQGEVLAPPGAVQQGLQQRLKAAFDPAGIFNPGRLYGWM